MRKICFSLLFFISVLCNAQTFSISIADSLKQPVLDGRLLLLLSKNNTAEPRMLINDAANTQMVFGINADNWKPGTTLLVDMHAFGYPVERLKDIPAGE